MLVGKSDDEASDARGSVDEDAVTSSVPKASLQLLAVSDAILPALLSCPQNTTTTTSTLVEECMRESKALAAASIRC